MVMPSLSTKLRSEWKLRGQSRSQGFRRASSVSHTPTARPAMKAVVLIRNAIVSPGCQQQNCQPHPALEEWVRVALQPAAHRLTWVATWPDVACHTLSASTHEPLGAPSTILHLCLALAFLVSKAYGSVALSFVASVRKRLVSVPVPGARRLLPFPFLFPFGLVGIQLLWSWNLPAAA